MRKIKSVLVGIICLMLLMPTAVMASKPEEWGDVDIANTATIASCKAGEKITIELPLVNLGNSTATNVRILPKRSSDPKVYPFTTTKTNEYTEYGSIDAGKTEKRNLKFTVRKDALSQSYTLKFDIEYYSGTQKVSLTKEVFINVKALTPTPKPTKKPKKTPAPEVPLEDEGDGGDYDDGGPSGGSGGSDGDDDEEKKTGTPRVIIEGFRTEPKVVNAGASFKLIMEIRNTSKKTAVNNMEINLQAADAADSVGEDSGDASAASDVFLPDKGSNTLYLDSIAADSTKEISIELTARADLQQQPYSIGIAMKYEDNKAEQYDTMAEISVPINQKARFELSQIEVTPESIEVGGDGNVVFSIYNLGRTKLYNVKVQLVDETIAEGEAFIGNLEAGATGEVDLMVEGLAETTDDGTVKIQISYEDKDGNAHAFESSCTILVMPAMNEGEMPLDEEMMMTEEIQGGISTPIKVGIGVGVVAVVAVVAFGIIKHKRKKEEDFADEFLGSDKDEHE